ncbi:MAG TPA: hypothetical protein VHC69_09155 [Polyangiaceae bacterium]|nr:hypothetical protein [Polyangiaceae bacterium]
MIRIDLSVVLAALIATSACAHQQLASVLPQGDDKYEIIGQSSTEQEAYSNAEKEARYTCDKQKKTLVVVNQHSAYQGADKNAKSDVGAGNVALAFFTGKSGKERDSDDYKVSLTIQCR